MNAAWYQGLSPLTQISSTKNTEFEVATTANGYRLATSIDGSLTGRGGDIIIVDEPLKPSEALTESRRVWVNNWFNNTLLSRLDDMRTGAIIVVMQRLHDDDLTGALTAISRKMGPPETAGDRRSGRGNPDRSWQISYSPRRRHSASRANAEIQLEARRILDPETFAAHYQQAPVPPRGIIIRRIWVQYYDVLPVRNSSSVVVQSWDTASKGGELNDWSVCTTWLIQDRRYYLIDVLREQLDYPSLRARAIAHARAYKPNRIVIEDTGVGTGLIQELKKASFPVVAVKPERNKKTRMQIQSAKFEAGMVFFPKQAPWRSDYEAEIFAFPNVHFDDQVDSTSQALACDHTAYDLDAVNRGWGEFTAALAFQRMFPC